VVMNWFFHRVYWTGWIAHHHRRRRRLVAQAAEEGTRRTVIGLTLLGATSVYREGFETVLFLQNLRLKYGSPVVLEGAAIGFALIAAVGVVTFAAHSRLPYRRLLVATGIMLGAVLIVIVGQTVQSFQVAGWLPVTRLAIAVPAWLSTWFSIFPTLEGLAAQVLAAAVVLGSYLVAENVTVKRPRARSAAATSQP
jgi:high-affinity iron transporter